MNVLSFITQKFSAFFNSKTPESTESPETPKFPENPKISGSPDNSPLPSDSSPETYGFSSDVSDLVPPSNSNDSPTASDSTPAPGSALADAIIDPVSLPKQSSTFERSVERAYLYTQVTLPDKKLLIGKTYKILIDYIIKLDDDEPIVITQNRSITANAQIKKIPKSKTGVGQVIIELTDLISRYPSITSQLYLKLKGIQCQNFIGSLYMIEPDTQMTINITTPGSHSGAVSEFFAKPDRAPLNQFAVHPDLPPEYQLPE